MAVGGFRPPPPELNRVNVLVSFVVTMYFKLTSHCNVISCEVNKDTITTTTTTTTKHKADKS